MLNKAVIHLLDSAQFEWNNHSSHKQMAGLYEIIIYMQASDCLKRKTFIHKPMASINKIISLQVNLPKLKFNG